uniref:SH3 domain-containing protein n=1 Tax=Strigamia maritima TaxID=126957 RepID=T1J6B7_STRMM
MIRALYDYNGVHKGTLAFKAGDKFLLLKEETGDANWWQVIDSSGRLGFIPNNFVVRLKGNRCSIISFTDQVLESLCNGPSTETDSGVSEDKIIEKVKAARDSALAFLSQTKTKKATEQPTPSDHEKKVPISVCDDTCRSQNDVAVPENLGCELIELIRLNTKLSYQLSKVAVVTALEHIKSNVPNVDTELSAIICMVNDAKDGSNLSISHDAKRLREIFFELKGVLDDEQQRSWTLYEDENAILQILEELVSILANADTAISRHCIMENNYDPVLCLVSYYQMEIRLTIRLLVLKVLGAMCALDAKVISTLLMSILPMELARDMQSSSTDIVRLNHISLLMTMIFSSGENPPLQVYEYINKNFVCFLLDTMERPPNTDLDDQVPDLFVAVLLAINLHAKQIHDNFVIKGLKQRNSAKVLTEKLLLLMNREEDPVCMFEHSPKWPNSSLKLLKDIFSCPDTAFFFYTNDMKVMLDIIVRNITNLPPEDERRNLYVKLCHLVLRNSDYVDHQHRRCDLQCCFQRILKDESPPSQQDICVVQMILSDFPQFFCM